MAPEMDIANMAQRSEVVAFGCEGRQCDTRTVSRWLASLKTDRRPGSRKKVLLIWCIAYFFHMA